MNEKAIQAVQTYAVSPLEQASNFLSTGGSMESLEKMMELQERFEERQAKKAFILAMAEFKKEPIKIKKDKQNKQYNSKYSSIDATISPCLQRMGECGLSHKWDFGPQTDQKFITGMCVVTHCEGHSDSVSMTSPIDTSGSKNPIQQIKSTRTYIKIETFTSVMGLTSSEDLDDDGNNSLPVKHIDEKQCSEITDIINSIDGFTMESFLSWAKLESVEMMPVFDFGKNMNALKVKAEAKK